MHLEEASTSLVLELAPLVLARAGTHTVQLYEEDVFLLDVLARIVTQGLESDDALVTVLTPDHQRGLDERLGRLGLDIAAARAADRWVTLDAVATLATLTRDGVVDERLLTPTVGASIDRAAKAAATGGVRLFGEMVNLLWQRGDRDTALAFEALWEIERVRRPGFSVLCAYPLRDFGRPPDAAGFDAVCRRHSHVVPTERYATLDGAGMRLHPVATLQPEVSARAGELVDVECTLCRRVLLTVPRISTDQADLLAAHLRAEHPGTLGAGTAMLGEILRPMLVTRRR